MREAGGRFWVAAYALACVMAGTNIASPLYSTYQHRFGFSALVLTAVFAVYIAVIVPGLLVFGSLADATGRRPILLFALAMALAGSAVLAAAQGVGWLLAGRIAEGISFAAAVGTGSAALVELHAKGDRRMAATVATGAFLGGSAVGPVLTGLLAEYAPWPLQLSYALHALLTALAIALLARIPEPLSPAQRRRWRPGRPAVPRHALRPFAFIAAAAGAAGTCGSVYLALSSSFAADLLHTRNLAIVGAIVGIFLAAGAVAQLVFAGLDPRRATVGGLAVVAAGLAVGAAAAPAGSILLLGIGSALGGAGQGVTFRGTLALVLELAPPAARADVTSTYYAVIYTATGLASVGIGMVATGSTLAASLPPCALAIAGLAVAMAVSTLVAGPAPRAARS